MRTSSRIFIAVVAVGIAVAAGAGYAWLKPALDQDPRSNLGYLAWKFGIHSYSPAYPGLMIRDPKFSQSLVGKRLVDVVFRFQLQIHDGANFPVTSYRGQYQESLKQREPKVRCYWFDDHEENFGYCLWVENDRIKRFMIVKG